ncbi:MAG TPA: glucose 1-dehydrogenase [Methylomirabilota bacterium]|jgi:NAD(P)-dependent dehydrogenase (short-subunit alcohol dehydrogenase family)|nr:glucose 1-dehydrogenase [Methylomirabilota bacterium]
MTHPLFDLTGRTAIVTGSGRGLGRAIALGLAEAGANLVTCARTPGTARSVAEEIAAKGGQALGLEIDCADRDQCDRLVEAALQRFGRLDVLVCNHGIGLNRPAEATTPAEWSEVLRVNLSGYFYAAQAAARPMLAQGKGAIVMNSSNGSFIGFPGLTAYGASKGGVDQLVRQLAVEWGERGIRVNAINPGWTENLMAHRKRQTADEEKEAEIRRMTPLRRRGRAEEMVGPVIFLASDASSFVTGVCLPVDGGWFVY